jgi:hypothetical protein
MSDLCAELVEVTRKMPLSLQAEVLDFAQFIQARHAPGKVKAETASDWVEKVWGTLPDFPDRLPQGSLTAATGF